MTFTDLIIGNLLHHDVFTVGKVQSGVAIVVVMRRDPLLLLNQRVERRVMLTITRTAGNDVHWTLGILVWVSAAVGIAFVDMVVDWQQAAVEMFVAIDVNVYAVSEEQFLETVLSRSSVVYANALADGLSLQLFVVA